MARRFKALSVVVFCCATVWHCCGCDLLAETINPEPDISVFETSELVDELLGRGFGWIFDGEEG